MSRIPDLVQTSRMYAAYQEGKSCSQVAALFGVTRQVVWDRFQRQGLKLRARPRPLPFIDFDGARYAPTYENYFRKTTGDRQLLHHAKWIKANGRIKRGHEVRFIDGDRLNLELDNLACVPRDEGAAISSARRFKIKSCIACGNPMGRRFSDKTRESLVAYARRKTCNARCSGDWKRGKRRGTRMDGNEDLVVKRGRA